MSFEREVTLEQWCRRFAEKRGHILLKTTGLKGWPDRLLIMKQGPMIFIEFKRPGETPKPLQLFHMDRLNNMGHYATWITTQDQFKDLLDLKHQCGLPEPTNERA